MLKTLNVFETTINKYKNQNKNKQTTKTQSYFSKIPLHVDSLYGNTAMQTKVHVDILKCSM